MIWAVAFVVLIVAPYVLIAVGVIWLWLGRKLLDRIFGR